MKIDFKRVALFLLVSPVTYLMIFPALALHFSLLTYQAFVFRVLKIPFVSSKDFFFYDRQLISKLNLFEKINCYYCSYYNNLLSYAVEIAGRTERFWCPIKYEHRLFRKHSQYLKFMNSHDGKILRTKWETLRKFNELK